MKERIQKIIASAGICSRRKAELLISEGKVKVNNKLAKLGDKAELSDEIEVNGKTIHLAAKKTYMLNKPLGFISASTDLFNRKTIFSIPQVKKIKERVFHIGRLDKDTSGLILLTNDGELANKIMHPRNEIQKTYLVELETPINPLDIEYLKKGIIIDERKTIPEGVELLSKNRLRIVIHEGRNRIIRKIMKKIGYEIKTLHRERIGKLKLDVKTGNIRHLSEKDIEKIFK